MLDKESLERIGVDPRDASGALTPTQRVLVDIWKRLLWIDELGLNDNFIDLGGNSLSATRCINSIRHTFHVEVPMDLFFQEPADIITIAHLIDEARARSVT